MNPACQTGRLVRGRRPPFCLETLGRVGVAVGQPLCGPANPDAVAALASGLRPTLAGGGCGWLARLTSQSPSGSGGFGLELVVIVKPKWVVVCVVLLDLRIPVAVEAFRLLTERILVIQFIGLRAQRCRLVLL